MPESNTSQIEQEQSAPIGPSLRKKLLLAVMASGFLLNMQSLIHPDKKTVAAANPEKQSAPEAISKQYGPFPLQLGENHYVNFYVIMNDEVIILVDDEAFLLEKIKRPLGEDDVFFEPKAILEGIKEQGGIKNVKYTKELKMWLGENSAAIPVPELKRMIQFLIDPKKNPHTIEDHGHEPSPNRIIYGVGYTSKGGLLPEFASCAYYFKKIEMPITPDAPLDLANKGKEDDLTSE